MINIKQVISTVFDKCEIFKNLLLAKEDENLSPSPSPSIKGGELSGWPLRGGLDMGKSSLSPCGRGLGRGVFSKKINTYICLQIPIVMYASIAQNPTEGR